LAASVLVDCQQAAAPPDSGTDTPQTDSRAHPIDVAPDTAETAPIDLSASHPDTHPDTADAGGIDVGPPVPCPCVGSRDVDAGVMSTCFVGQTYCIMTRLVHDSVDTSATRGQCQPLMGCASNPTCACIQPQPYVNCTCADNPLILRCDQI
jgi:hypothetical protein